MHTPIREIYALSLITDILYGHNRYKAHPTTVKAIFIRRVSGVDPTLEKTLNAPERFETAFKGIPKGIWKVFDDPAELDGNVNALVNA